MRVQGAQVITGQKVFFTLHYLTLAAGVAALVPDLVASLALADGEAVAEAEAVGDGLNSGDGETTISGDGEGDSMGAVYLSLNQTK